MRLSVSGTLSRGKVPGRTMLSFHLEACARKTSMGCFCTAIFTRWPATTIPPHSWAGILGSRRRRRARLRSTAVCGLRNSAFWTWVTLCRLIGSGYSSVAGHIKRSPGFCHQLPVSVIQVGLSRYRGSARMDNISLGDKFGSLENR